jgi:hypothetical protein
MYLDKLKPDGVVLLHTSNRYLDLESVLSAIQKELPQGTSGIVVSDNHADGSYAQSTSTVVIFTKSEQALAPYRSIDGSMELEDNGIRAGEPGQESGAGDVVFGVAEGLGCLP